jgi:cytosine/uracil/thiamine/allantoin permease
MQKRDFSDVQHKLRRGFIVAWVSAAVSFSLALYLLKHGYEALGWTFAITFAVVVVWGLAFAFWRVHRVKCPECGSHAPTRKDESGHWWVATCDRCQIQWDLKTGVD